MGDIIPPTWPSLDPDKFYCVKTACYTRVPGVIICNVFRGNSQCCVAGSLIIEYYEFFGDCHPNLELCCGFCDCVSRVLEIGERFDFPFQCFDACPILP